MNVCNTYNKAFSGCSHSLNAIKTIVQALEGPDWLVLSSLCLLRFTLSPLYHFLTAENKQEYAPHGPHECILCFDNIVCHSHWSHAWNKSKLLSHCHGSQNPDRIQCLLPKCSLFLFSSCTNGESAILKLDFITLFWFKDILKEFKKKKKKEEKVKTGDKICVNKLPE